MSREGTMLKYSILIILFFSFTSFSQITLYSHDHSTLSYMISPEIKITNTSSSSVNLKQYTIEYYWYNTKYPADEYHEFVYHFTGPNHNILLTIEKFIPPYTAEPLKANMLCRISFLVDRWLDPGVEDILAIGIYSHDYGYQDQDNDWSFIPGSQYQFANNIVVRNHNGIVIFGKVPGPSSIKPKADDVHWLGAIDNSTFDSIQNAGLFNNGDAYRNDDGNAYVLYQGTWELLNANSGTDEYKNGWTMNSGLAHIQMNGSNLLDAYIVESDLVEVGDIRADYVCEAQTISIEKELILHEPDPAKKPVYPTDNMNAKKGTIAYYQDGGDWYLYIKVSLNPHTWRRVKLSDW